MLNKVIQLMLRHPDFSQFEDEFPVMLTAEDICGRWLCLCRHAAIDVGLAPLRCLYL